MRGEHPHQSIATIIPRMVRINHDKLPKQRDVQEAVHHNRVDEQMINICHVNITVFAQVTYWQS